MRTFLRSKTCSMVAALLSVMLYPSNTYCLTRTSQANHRWLKAAFRDRKWGGCPGWQQQKPASSSTPSVMASTSRCWQYVPGQTENMATLHTKYQIWLHHKHHFQNVCSLFFSSTYYHSFVFFFRAWQHFSPEWSTDTFCSLAYTFLLTGHNCSEKTFSISG